MKIYALCFCLALSLSATATEPPPIKTPRQTSGDKVVQQKWDEQLTVTVGNKDADIVGADTTKGLNP